MKSEMNTDRFTITEDHLKLLGELEWEWRCETDPEMDGKEYGVGGPCVNLKRPFGNSDWERDVMVILGWKWDEGWERDGEEEAKMYGRLRDIYGEMQIVLEIVLDTMSFLVGEYEAWSGGSRDRNDWRWIRVRVSR